MISFPLDLDDEMHVRLRELARRHGRTISDLVLDALASLRAIEGLWSDRDDIGPTDAYLRRFQEWRGPGAFTIE